MRSTLNAGEVGDIEFNRFHAWIGSDNFIEQRLAAAGDDDLVAALVERLGEAAADAGGAAGDEDGVVREFHDVSFRG